MAQPVDDDRPVDVLIVGAGAAGSVAARSLAVAGIRVMCLEQGDWVDPDTYLSATPDAELAWAERWNPDPMARRNPADYPIIGDGDVSPVMFNGVGGSMISWAAMWHPLLPSDFSVRAHDGVADDWPIDYATLQPYYDRAAVEMRVSGLAGDPASPRPEPSYLPPLPIGRLGRTAARGMNRLGWHWWPGTNAISSVDHGGGLHPCRLRGTCIIGCPEGAKAHPGLTHWPDAIRHGARLVTGARVRELPLDDRGLVRGAVYIDRDGIERSVRADVVLLAANAVGSARLLLLSRSRRFPNGLANTSGLVGKRLMQHPYATVTGLFDESLDSWRGPWGQAGYSLEFYETATSRGFVRGAKWNLMPIGGPTFVHDVFQSSYADRPFEETWGPAFHQNLLRGTGHGFVWGIQSDDLPEETNSVTLDPSLADSDGLPAAKITYHISDNTRRILAFNLDRAREAMEAAGAVETFTSGVWPTGIGHVLGTARMGDDPQRSVVDRWGRTHDVPNLYVIDSSVFVTGGAMNPGATIIALALRTADHLIRSGRAQPVPA